MPLGSCMIYSEILSSVGNMSDNLNYPVSNMAYNINDSQTPVTSSFPINIGSLNCCGHTKSANTSVRQHFIRYLGERSLDLTALQETHAINPDLRDIFHTQFQAHSSLWSDHCGLVFFSPNLTFQIQLLALAVGLSQLQYLIMQIYFLPLQLQ